MNETSTQPAEPQAIEAHRPIARQLDKSFASVYGFGGMGVVAFAMIPVASAWWQGWLAEPGTWVVAITFGLIALYPLRGIVKRRKAELAQRFRSYCGINDIDPAPIVAQFAADGEYPYFVALFEERTSATASMDEP